jgi:hypothetical protein
MAMQNKELHAQTGRICDYRIKSSVMKRFKKGFIEWLTRSDLEELQFYQGNQFDEKYPWNSAAENLN